MSNLYVIAAFLAEIIVILYFQGMISMKRFTISNNIEAQKYSQFAKLHDNHHSIVPVIAG